MNRRTGFVSAGLALALLAGQASAQVLVDRADVVAKVGDVAGATSISSLNSPFTNNNGQVGFVAAMADSTRGIWFDSGFTWNSANYLPTAVTGGEGTMGISDGGAFIYSPSWATKDAVANAAGKILADDDAWPPNPTLFNSFDSRPQMVADGTAFWIAGTSATAAGSTSLRHLVKCVPPYGPTDYTIIWSGGDVISGKPIATAASNFTYDVSDDAAHVINELDMNTGSTANNVHIFVDGSLIMQEGTPTGQGDNWSNVTDVSINNSGIHVVGGDTDGNTATDTFLAYNGTITIREGDTIAGITLATGAGIRAVSVNNNNRVAHIWGWGSGATLQEHVFISEAGNPSSTWRVLSVGNGVDTTGDNVPEWTVTDLEASATIGPGLDFGEDGFVFVEVSLVPFGGGTEVEAILKVPVCPADYNADGFVDAVDYDAFIADWLNSSNAADFNDDGFPDAIDYDQFIARWLGAC